MDLSNTDEDVLEPKKGEEDDDKGKKREVEEEEKGKYEEGQKGEVGEEGEGKNAEGEEKLKLDQEQVVVAVEEGPKGEEEEGGIVKEEHTREKGQELTEGEKVEVMEEIKEEKALVLKDTDEKMTEPSASSASDSVQNCLEYLVEAMLREGSSATAVIRTPKPSILKRGHDERISACEKVIDHVNSVEFSSLNDKQTRTFLMIREISRAVIIGQRKLPTEGDVSRVLKVSIERMVLSCRRMVEQISGMDLKDLNEEEKQTLSAILKIARGIISKQGTQLEED